ncbi:putative ribonuclease H protein [Sesamum angolense]|uniref:Ribonuclease H protein n=1 Tax=Sesamum angolense TaxID=2727404 RepID=A0AAE1X3Z0_9LAMI|nr:putative ribonuclease H protein [Sesamum angolense]
MFQPITSKNGLCPGLRVADLIDEATHSCKTEQIDNLFWHDDAAVIKAIPIGHFSSPDTQVWHYNKNGSFSFKSTYHIACRLPFLRNNQVLGHSSKKKMNWNAIWKARVPNKIKVFLWCVCKEAIPTTSNLIRRTSDVEPACTMCGAPYEDSKHALLSVLSLGKPRPLLTYHGLLFHNGEMSRNKRVMENKQSSPMEVVASARSFLKDFQNCIVRKNPPNRFSAPTWSPPKSGTIKINFDASVAKEWGGIGLGVIARDHEGNCVAWRTKTLLGATDPEHCEALAARLVVDLGIEQGWCNCLIEGDCILVIQKLLVAKEDASAIGPIISDILHLSHFFDSLSYAHVKRTANSAAHYLAKAAFTIQAGGDPQSLCLKPCG